MPACFALYKLPGTDKIFLIEGKVVEGFYEGFVVKPFLACDKEFTICGKPSELRTENILSSVYRLFSDAERYRIDLPVPTNKKQYFEGACKILEAIEEGECKKVVYSRVIRGEINDSAKMFCKLCASYSDAYIFSFFTPKTGLWIGASPELLCSAQGDEIHSMALAGTMKADATEGWNQKNLEEQAFVTDYIVQALSTHCENVSISSTQEKIAGPVKHLCTYISASLPEHEFVKTVTEVASDLSPTPALGGLPKFEALQIIDACEQHKRECYGGFCGIFHPDAKRAIFWVTLRCMKISSLEYALFSGGGYTRMSQPELEWEETAAKAETLQRELKR